MTYKLYKAWIIRYSLHFHTWPIRNFCWRWTST
jgi:hypothetical protein